MKTATALILALLISTSQPARPAPIVVGASIVLFIDGILGVIWAGMDDQIPPPPPDYHFYWAGVFRSSYPMTAASESRPSWVRLTGDASGMRLEYLREPETRSVSEIFPAPSESTPPGHITIGHTVSVVATNATSTVLLQSSTDLKTWTSFARFGLAPGDKFSATRQARSQEFFRMIVM